MSLASYSDLKASVADWLGRSDLTAVVPDFIAMFEAHFRRKAAGIRRGEQRDQNTSFSTEYTALPNDCLSVVSLKLTGATVYQLQEVSTNWIDENYPDPAADTPRFFAVVGTEIRVAPPPDSTYTAEIVYHTFDALSDSNTTNWLLTSHPDLYLKGSLVEAEAYLVNDPRVAMWKAFRDEGIDDLVRAEKRAKWGGGVLRVRPDVIA